MSSNNIAAKLGLVDPQLMPENDSVSVHDGRFVYHPMLQVKPAPNYSSRHHRGLLIKHNSLGLRGDEIDFDKATKTNLINVYGGSTTYDVGVRNGKTWPEQLQYRLGDQFTVLNLGMPGYSSAENVIQTAFYSNVLKKPPQCAIYYIGWNDIRNAHIPNLDEGYADFHLLSQLDGFRLRPQPITFSPLLKIFTRYLIQWADTAPRSPNFSALPPQSGSDIKLEAIYKKNIETIVAINNVRKTNTIFIGQLLNPSRLTSDRAYGWLPLVKDKDVWPLQSHFNSILKDTAKEIGAHYIGADINEFLDADFIDNGHFSEAGSEKFSNLIQSQVRNICSM